MLRFYLHTAKDTNEIKSPFNHFNTGYLIQEGIFTPDEVNALSPKKIQTICQHNFEVLCWMANCIITQACTKDILFYTVEELKTYFLKNRFPIPVACSSHASLCELSNNQMVVAFCLNYGRNLTFSGLVDNIQQGGNSEKSITPK